MVSKSDLNSHANIKITSKSGVVDAPENASNFYIDAPRGDILNYAREGGDLVIEFKDGQKLLIKNFFAHGLEFNNLLLSDGGSLLLVDFSKALSGQDGINDPDVIYHELNGVDATAVLLGLLGAGGIAAAIAFANSSNYNYTPPVVDTAPPSIPSLDSVYDKVESIVGPIVAGTSTNDPRPTFSGTAMPGTVIKFYDNGQLIGSTVAASDGHWSWEPEVDLADGAHSITYTASDGAGNESAHSDPFEFSVDTLAPSTPTTPLVMDNTEPHVGPILPGSSTNETQPEFSGTGEPGSTITIKDGDTIIGTTTVDSNGNWSVKPDAPLPEGNHSITVTETDTAGNESSPSAPIDFTVDTTAPVTPSVPTATDNTEPHVGPILPGSSTNETQPEFSGTGEPGSTITIKDGDTVIGTTTVGTDGNWSVKPDAALPEGNHSITVTETDTAGNESSPSAPIDFTVDTTAPATPSAPTATDNTEPVVGPIAPGSSTNETQPEFSGTGEPGSTITIKDGDTVIGTTTVGTDGNWSVKPDAALPEGNHSITVTETDKAGNESSPSAPIDFTVDTTAPATPSAPSVTDNQEPVTGPVTAGGSTNDTQPEFSGTGEAGSTITIKDGDTVIGTTTVGTDGNWSVKPDAPLTEGSHSVTVTETDTAGNESSPSAPIDFTVDTTPPATPSVPTATDNTEPVIGAITAGSSTNDTKPEFKGTGEPGSTITIKDGDTVIGTTTADSDGKWTLKPENPLSDGNHSITVTATDAAGNTSTPSGSLDFNVDTVIPNPIDTSKMDLVDDFGPVQGTINRGDPTDDRTPTYSGAAGSVDANDASSINIYNKDASGVVKLIGSTSVNADGSWSFDPNPPLTPGDYIFSARPVDKAGNEGPATTDWNFTLVGDAPADPAITSVSDNEGSVQGTIQKNGVTDDTTPVVKGTGEAGSTITIHVEGPDGVSFVGGTTTVNANGSWTIEITPAFSKGDGTYTIKAQANDSAGQLSNMTGGFPVVLDTTAPATPSQPTITDNVGDVTGALSANDTTDDKQPVLSGNAGSSEAGGTVTIKDGDTVLGTTSVGADGSWSFTPPAPGLSDGSHSITVTVTDKAGNESAASPAFNITVDTSNVVVSFSHFEDNVGTIQGNVKSGGISDDRTPVMVGSASANATVTVSYVNAAGTKVVVGTTTADSTGAWSLTPSADLSDGKYSFSAEAVNAAGVKGTVSFTLEIDATAPSAPVINEVLDDVGFIQGPITSGSSTDDTTPTFSGTGEVGSTITIKDKDGTVVGTTTVDSDGKWSVTTDELAEGTHNLTVTSTDAAGNVSDGAQFDVIVDTTGPSATAALQSISDDTGFDTADFITNDTTLIYTIKVTGTLETGDTVWMRIKPEGGTAGQWIQATKNVDGTYSVNHNDADHALTDGRYTIETVVRDAAGNPSTPSTQNIEIDTQGPTGGTVTISGYFDDVGAITGDITTSGTSTDDTTPLLKGTVTGLQDGDRVVIKVTGSDGVAKVLGTATVTGGTWSYQVTDAQALSEGDYKFEAIVTDKAGNEGSKSGLFNLNVDTTAPAAIDTSKMDLVDDFGPVQGTINRGDPTDDRTPTYSGAAGSVDANDASSINIYNKDASGVVKLIGSTSVNADGSWSFDPNPPLTPGDYIFSARPVDKAGNEGPATTDWNFTLVGDAPADPAITSVSDNEGSVQGTIQKNGVTDDTTPVVKGTGEAGSTITIHVEGPDGVSFVGGTTTVNANGSWTIEITPAFSKGDGTYTIKAQANDSAGQLSNMTGGFPVVLDTTAPATPSQPTITDNVGDVTGALSANDTTDDKQPVLSGNAGSSEAGGTVTIKDGDTVLGTTSVGADGSWSFTPPAPGLSDGSHSITVTVTDKAGNESAASPAFNITVDTSNVVVSFSHFEDNVGTIQGNVKSGGISDDRTPVMVGSASANATVTVSYVNAAGTKVVVGTTTADSTGAWSLTPSADLSDGKYSFSAEAVNAAGVKGTVSFTLEIDATAPSAPVINEVLDDVGFIQGPITSGSSTDDTTPTFSGTGEVGSTITIKDKDGTVVGTTTVDSDGKWSVTTDELAEGTHNLTVTSTDAAGNVSDGAQFDVIVDTTGPSATAALQSISDDTGFDTADFITNDTTLIYTIKVTGTLETGDTVWMRIKPEGGTAGQWIQATKNVDGTYSVNHNDADHALTDGRYTIETVVRDAAGNPSTPSTQNIEIDTQGPTGGTVTISGYFDDVGAITGDITTSGTSTDDTTPLLKGTVTGLQDGDRVVIKVTGSDGVTKVLGTATVTGGTWSYQVTDAQALSEGDYKFEAIVTDKAGNEGSKSGLFDLNVDTTAPAAIDTSKMDLVDDFGPVQGTINRGDPTDDRTPTYSGAAGSVDANDASSINIYNKDANGVVKLIGSTSVNADGSWSFDPNPPLTPGDYIFSARPVDKAGNEGPATTDWNFTLVGDAPADPAITSVSDNEGSVQGALQKNGVTDDTTPVVKGTGEAGSTITIHVEGPDGVSFVGGTTTVNANGSWTIEITPAFSKGDGTYTIKAQANDSAGQLSNMTGGFPVVLDTTAPATPSQPTITDNVGDVTGALSANDTTDDKQPVLSGNAGSSEAGGTVTIKDGDTVLGTTSVGADGSWSFTPPAPGLSDGSHSITVTVTDKAGNESAASPAFNITVDTSNVVVSFSHFEDNVGTIQGNVKSGGISDDRTPVMVGSASANATVTVSYVNAAGTKVVVGTTTADSTGAWSLTPSVDLADGKYSFSAEAVNAAGVKGTVSFTLEIDATAPSAPVINEVLDDVGFIQGPITSGSSTDDTTPTFSGTGEVGSTITIKDKDGTVVGTTTVDSDGKWSVTTDELAEGTHNLTVTSTDAAGNVSDGAQFDVIVDTTGPSATAALQSISDDTGFDTADFITNDTTLIYTIKVTGTLETGDTVWMRIKPEGGTAGQWIQATKNVDGTYSVNHNDADHALTDGRYTIETVVRDAAGNPSTPSTQVVTIDTSLPITGYEVAITGFFDDVGLIQGDITTSGTSTDDTTPLLKGTVTGIKTGDEVVIKVTGPDGTKIILGTATVTDGTWEYQVTEAQKFATEGKYTFEAVVTNIAGNEGKTSTGFDLNLDLTAPTATSSITGITDDTGFSDSDYITSDDTLIIHGSVSETLNAGEKVQIRIDGGTWVDAVYNATDKTWSYDNQANALSEGDHKIESRVVDAAGNITTGGSQTVTIDKTGPVEGYEVAISGFFDDVGLIQGDMTTSGTSTDDTTPLLKGTVTGIKTGDEVVIKVTGPDGTKIILGNATVTNGTWQYQVTEAQKFVTEGKYTFEAVVTDKAGNEGKTSTFDLISLILI
ncbi:Ig-like domain-containing protein [Bartonella sp. HY328]|uniref:Ig-like domain-containing protein n=1 Tax=Bartonella sp. HY328 TaxID=2979320 RepID=UPI0021C9AB52|nr:Ig-like domain-containing protein [Bartonella sp. HY328]UXN09434.1 Ig-like domain-containing protein [Bartonella sp. HY328]